MRRLGLFAPWQANHGWRIAATVRRSRPSACSIFFSYMDPPTNSWGPGGYLQVFKKPPPPLCDIPSGCCSFTGPWTVTRSSLRMLRRVAAFCRPLRPVLLLVSFPRSRSPVVGVLGLC